VLRGGDEISPLGEGQGETDPCQESREGILGGIEGAAGRSQEGDGPADVDPLQEMEESEEEPRPSGLDRRPAKDREDAGEKGLGLVRPALLPAKDGEAPEIDGVLLGRAGQEGGPLERRSASPGSCRSRRTAAIRQ
jgi:hypothetical protein